MWCYHFLTENCPKDFSPYLSHFPLLLWLSAAPWMYSHDKIYYIKCNNCLIYSVVGGVCWRVESKCCFMKFENNVNLFRYLQQRNTRKTGNLELEMHEEFYRKIIINWFNSKCAKGKCIKCVRVCVWAGVFGKREIEAQFNLRAERGFGDTKAVVIHYRRQAFCIGGTQTHTAKATCNVLEFWYPDIERQTLPKRIYIHTNTRMQHALHMRSKSIFYRCIRLPDISVAH